MPSIASGERRHGETTSRVTPSSSQRCDVVARRDRRRRGRSGSRPCVAAVLVEQLRAGARSAPRAGLEVWPMPIQPSPRRAARRSAASLSPPTRIGGHGCCTGFGSNTTSSKSKNSPWCVDLGLGPQPLADLDRLVDPPAAGREVEPGRDPLLLEPARADAELEPAARDDVERLHARAPRRTDGAGRGCRRACRAGRARCRAGEEREVRERVEDRRGRRHRRVLLARVRRAAHRRR